jgi:hypothetical protein
MPYHVSDSRQSVLAEDTMWRFRPDNRVLTEVSRAWDERLAGTEHAVVLAIGIQVSLCHEDLMAGVCRTIFKSGEVTWLFRNRRSR